MPTRLFVGAIALCIISLPLPILAGPRQGQAAQNQTPSAPPSLKGFVLEEGTPIKLKLNRNVSSADARVGDNVDFEVIEEIDVNGVTVVPKGGIALGTVTEAQPKRRMGRGGKLDMNLDSVRLVDGEKAALRAVKESKGGGHTGAMTAGIVATGLLVWPAAPFFLFMHGKDVTVPKGAEITAYVNGDMKLEVARFQPVPSRSTTAADKPPAPTPDTDNGTPPAQDGAPKAIMWTQTAAKFSVTSVPDGAEIEIDGNFVGNAPSDVQVTEGDHTITVKKTGFRDWTKKMKVSGGSSIHLSAELEKAPSQ